MFARNKFSYHEYQEIEKVIEVTQTTGGIQIVVKSTFKEGINCPIVVNLSDERFINAREGNLGIVELGLAGNGERLMAAAMDGGGGDGARLMAAFLREKGEKREKREKENGKFGGKSVTVVT
ncbi:hypothetical protein H5410_050163 [Solanum commersonii]|uniref:Uncharacterized protein n=1 Tax=Solanum commersonii TaxID=4109 RepID=A0A9J5WX29_SOLCO|nr:hypothetical protein H5410_050163 [Solanum commersonii]